MGDGVMAIERMPEAYEDLARDPAHGGAITSGSIREREVALALEGAGVLPAPIRRDPTGAAEWDVDLDGRDLTEAQSPGAVLRGLTLHGCRFASANLARSDFTEAVLNDVTMVKANLDHARFDGARVVNGSWFRASTVETRLATTDFQGWPSTLGRRRPPRPRRAARRHAEPRGPPAPSEGTDGAGRRMWAHHGPRVRWRTGRDVRSPRRGATRTLGGARALPATAAGTGCRSLRYLAGSRWRCFPVCRSQITRRSRAASTMSMQTASELSSSTIRRI